MRHVTRADVDGSRSRPHDPRPPVVVRVEAAVELVVVAVVPKVVNVDVDVPPSPTPTPAPRSPPGIAEDARGEAEDEPRGCAPDVAGAEAVRIRWTDPYVADPRVVPVAGAVDDDAARSEEHTSELQSRGHLVCRLLLEKKK